MGTEKYYLQPPNGCFCLGLNRFQNLLLAVLIASWWAGCQARGGQLVTIYNYTGGADGYQPTDISEDASGNIYSTVAYTNDPNKLKHRVIYQGRAINEITAGNHIFENVFTMPSFQPYPDQIFGTLYFDAAENIFGLSAFGGLDGDGSCYEISADRRSVSLVTSFSGANGLLPISGLIPSGNSDLYGGAEYGGIGWSSGSTAFSGNGTLFEIAVTSKTITPITFFNGDNGANPIGKLLLDSSGNIFGATVQGGANNEGTVYELPAGSNTPITLDFLTIGGRCGVIN